MPIKDSRGPESLQEAAEREMAHTPEQLEKGRQVTKYYADLPADAPASPPEPIFKDILNARPANGEAAADSQ